MFDPARGVDEVHRIVVVLFNAGGNGKNVRVKNDVFGRKVELIDQHAVGAFANFNLALISVGLTFFVKRHHHRSSTIALEQFGLVHERHQPFLHRYRIDNALALNAAQASLDHAPLGAVDHDGHARNIGLAGDQVQKPDHRCLAVQHGLVHVDVDDLRAVFNLLAGHGQRRIELAIQNHARKGLGARDVGALTDIDEQAVRVNIDRLKARQLHGGNHVMVFDFRHNSP